MYTLSRVLKKVSDTKPTILYYTGRNRITDAFFRPGMSKNKKDAFCFKSYNDAEVCKKRIESLIQFQRGFELNIEKV